MLVINPDTQLRLLEAYQMLVEDLKVAGAPDPESLKDTPRRVVSALSEFFSGMTVDPSEVLRVTFAEDNYDQMIVVNDIAFDSICEHHLLPFHGRVHFGYLPKRKVVGLSKIPRLIEAFSRRPQIQERLTRSIVDTFQSVVEPLGCGAVVEAWHSCVGVRGIRKPEATMRTVALSGLFCKADVKAEFLDAAKAGKR